MKKYILGLVIGFALTPASLWACDFDCSNPLTYESCIKDLPRCYPGRMASVCHVDGSTTLINRCIVQGGGNGSGNGTYNGGGIGGNGSGILKRKPDIIIGGGGNGGAGGNVSDGKDKPVVCATSCNDDSDSCHAVREALCLAGCPVIVNPQTDNVIAYCVSDSFY